MWRGKREEAERNAIEDAYCVWTGRVAIHVR